MLSDTQRIPNFLSLGTNDMAEIFTNVAGARFHSFTSSHFHAWAVAGLLAGAHIHSFTSSHFHSWAVARLLVGARFQVFIFKARSQSLILKTLKGLAGGINS